MSRIRWLCRPMTPVVFDLVADRAIGAETFTDRDRMAALTKTLEAWPAVAEPRPGYLLVRPPYGADGDVPEAEYFDGPGGTLVSVSPTWPAELAPNGCFVASAPQSGFAVSGRAAMDVGPFRWGGPYGFVPDFFASPVLTTDAQCRDVAVARLARAQRRAYRVKGTLVPDHRLQVGSIVRLVTADTDVVARVAAVTHPLTVADGLTEIEAAVISGTLFGVDVAMATQTTSAQLNPADIPYGRTIFPVTSSGTWTEGMGWRADTTHLWVGRDDRAIHMGYCWWGAGPAFLPGRLTAGSVWLATEGERSGSKTMIHLVAGFFRIGDGRPVSLATVEGPTPTADGVEFPIPADWLARIDSGEAGGIGISSEGESFTVTAWGQSTSLQIEWRN